MQNQQGLMVTMQNNYNIASKSKEIGGANAIGGNGYNELKVCVAIVMSLWACAKLGRFNIWWQVHKG